MAIYLTDRCSSRFDSGTCNFHTNLCPKLLWRQAGMVAGRQRAGRQADRHVGESERVGSVMSKLCPSKRFPFACLPASPTHVPAYLPGRQAACLPPRLPPHLSPHEPVCQPPRLPPHLFWVSGDADSATWSVKLNETPICQIIVALPLDGYISDRSVFQQI